MSQASVNHNRLVGSLNPCHAGGFGLEASHLLFPLLIGGDADVRIKRQL